MVHRRPITHKGGQQTAAEIYADSVHYVPSLGEFASSYHQWIVGLTTAGYCNYCVESRRFTVGAGDLVVIRPHNWMTVRVCDRVQALTSGERVDPAQVGFWETTYAVFHPYPHWLPWLEELDYQEGVWLIHLIGHERTQIARALLRVSQVYQAGERLRDDRALNMLERALIEIRRHTMSMGSASDARIDEAIDIINRRYADPLTVGEIAREVSLSPDWFSRIFVSATGVGPSQYLERIRLARAAEMLRYGNLPVGDIAQAVGYADPFYFTRRFRMHYGRNPTLYRKAARPSPP